MSLKKSETFFLLIKTQEVMLGKVVVTADSLGRVIGVSENPEYGYVRIEQLVTTINEDGWLRTGRRSVLIKGKITDLQAVNYKEGQELPGKIIVRESLIPFSEEYADRDLKKAGDTGIVCRVDDQPIYRQTFYTLNEDAKDELISHTNGDEIKETQKSLKSTGALDALREKAKLASL